MRFQRILLIVCALTSKVFSSNDSLKWFVGIRGGAIYSKALPKYLYKDYSSRNHSFWFTESDDHRLYLPGFYCGFSFNRPTKKGYFNLLLDISNHSLKYNVHESMGSGVTPSTSYRVKKVQANFFGLNYQIQFERRLFWPFYLTNGFMFHQNLTSYWLIEENIVVSTYTNGSVSNTTELKDFSRGFEWISGVSYRLGVMWDLRTVAPGFAISAFRNFGWPARPWWGLGLIYYPKLRKN